MGESFMVVVTNYYIKQAASHYFPSSLGPLMLKASLARRQTPFSFPQPCQLLRHFTSAIPIVLLPLATALLSSGVRKGYQLLLFG